jgi:hypothetical protein
MVFVLSEFNYIGYVREAVDPFITGYCHVILCTIINREAAIAQSILRLAMGWTVQ